MLSLAHTSNAQTYVQSQTVAVGTSSTSDSATFSAAPTAGHTVVVGVDCFGPSGCTIGPITDNFNNTYSKIGPTATYGGPTTNVTNVVLYCASGISAGSNFTVSTAISNAGGGDSNLYIAEYSGVTCTVDQSASGSLTNGTATTSFQTNSVTTTNVNDLLVAIGSASTGNNATPGTGYALRQNGNSGAAEYGGFEDEVVTATGSYSGSMSLAVTTNYWAMVMVALEGSSSGSTPTVTSFTPTCGPVSTSVTITGTNFTGATAVKFNGTSATSFTVNSATQITAAVPSSATTGPISVTTPSGTGTSPGNFTVGSCPSITYIQSQKNATSSTASSLAATFSTTPTAGDTIVVGLDCFGSTNCTTSSITDSAGNSYAQIGPTASHGGAQNITNVWLYCASGIATGSNFTVTAHLTDTGSSGDSDIYIAEYSGVTCGVDQSATGSLTSGTATALLQTSSVTTTNANDLLVAIGSASAGNAATAGSGYTLRQNDDGGTAEYGGLEDQIVSATGSYSGSMTVAVTTTDWAMVMVALKGASGGGGGAPTITSFTPTSGPAGTSVNITGTNFTGATAVKFNGFSANSFTFTSATQITAAIVPNTATTGPISVTTPSGTGTSSTNFTVTTTAPAISRVSPPSGPTGISVSVIGSNFGSTPGTVKFNGTVATTTTWSATLIIATVPSGTTTGLVTATVGTQTSNGVTFTVTSAAGEPNITGLTPTSAAVGAQVTITGNGFGATQGSGVVWLGTQPGNVVSWSDTQIVATVASGAKTGNARVQQNEALSNSVPFTVSGSCP